MPILRFFAPQGRNVAPMGVKFGVEEGTAGFLNNFFRFMAVKRQVIGLCPVLYE